MLRYGALFTPSTHVRVGRALSGGFLGEHLSEKIGGNVLPNTVSFVLPSTFQCLIRAKARND
jgi:hypothetical protein